MKERIWISRVAGKLVSLGCKVVWCLCLGAMSVLLLEGESDSEVSEAHNIWTPLLEPIAHSDIGPMVEELLDEEVVRRVGVCCHFALDVLCAELRNFWAEFPCEPWRALILRCLQKARLSGLWRDCHFGHSVVHLVHSKLVWFLCPLSFSFPMSLPHSQQPTSQTSFLTGQARSNPVDVAIDAQHSPISNTGSRNSDSGDSAVCPPLGGLSGDDFTNTGVPGAGVGATTDQLIRDLSVQVTRQSEQFAFFSRSMEEMQRQLHALTNAASRTTEWMRSHDIRANDI